MKELRPPEEFPSGPLDVPAGLAVSEEIMGVSLSLTPQVADAPDITAPPGRGKLEVREGRLEGLRDATFDDIAALVPHRGPYKGQDQLLQRERCLHLPETRALTDRSRDLAELAVTEAADLVEVGEQLTEKYLQRGNTHEDLITCTPVCESEELAQLREVTTSPENTVALQKAAAVYGKERRPIPLEGEHDVIAQVVDAVVVDTYFSYSRVSGRSQEFIRERPGSCMEGAYLTQQRLREIGLETDIMQYTKPPYFQHFFLRMESGLSEPLLIDPTWQQFMPKDSDRGVLPHAIIVPASRISKAVDRLGVPPQHRGVWAAGQPYPRMGWEHGSTTFDMLIETDGWYATAMEMLPSLRALLHAARTRGR